MDKKTSFYIFLGILILLGCPLYFVSAQLHSYGPNISLGNLLGNILRATWIIFTAIAVIFFVFAGIMFLTSQGDAEKIKTARYAVIWGVVGIIVGIIAYSIISIIGGVL